MFDEKKYNQEYSKTKKGKVSHRKSEKKYEKTEKGRLRKKRYYYSEKGNIAAIKYASSKKGKETRKEYNKKHYTNNKEYYNIKTAKRKRRLQWIKLFDNPFDDLELIDWHHINNEEVVALPRDLHRLYYGKNHYEKMMPIIEQIYKIKK